MQHAMQYATKHAIWFVRFWYAGWMIPAGVEHFYHIFPQPGANSPHPLAAEMLTALLNTHLFDLVKAVELIAGVAVLFGFFTPLALLIAMPIAFNVWWWDAPLSEWSRGSMIAGSRLLGSQLLLCVAYIAAFRSMFPVKAPATTQLVLAGRLIFGAWMLVNGLNHFFLQFWPTPGGATPLSTELMTALVDSQLLDVCMLIELVAGALILLGVFVPAALATVMAVSVSALFWAVLDHQPVTLLLGLLAFALNGLLMLAYLPAYKGALERAPLALGERDRSTSFNAMFVQTAGRTARGVFLAALVPLALAVWWYAKRGPAANYACWAVLCLLYPVAVLHVRRLHDMGRSGRWVLVPTVLTVLAMLIWAGRISFGGSLDNAVPIAALVVFLGFALWGGIAKGQAGSNAFGEPVAA